MVEKPMPEKKTITDTVKRLQLDDLAKQVVIRMQRNPKMVIATDPLLKELKRLADSIIENDEMPDAISSWIAVRLFGSPQWVNAFRRAAIEGNNSSYHQAEQWLLMLDNLEQRASGTREDS